MSSHCFTCSTLQSERSQFEKERRNSDRGAKLKLQLKDQKFHSSLSECYRKGFSPCITFALVIQSLFTQLNNICITMQAWWLLHILYILYICVYIQYQSVLVVARRWQCFEVWSGIRDKKQRCKFYRFTQDIFIINQGMLGSNLSWE